MTYRKQNKVANSFKSNHRVSYTNVSPSAYSTNFVVIADDIIVDAIIALVLLGFVVQLAWKAMTYIKYNLKPFLNHLRFHFNTFYSGQA